ncbi:MAG: hypothetical protein Q7R49_06715 [Candidatus Daviesbacteria bacterium]|nr:hypothetical protein [Candidatus Daviesbacteria bacterium]
MSLEHVDIQKWFTQNRRDYPLSDLFYLHLDILKQFIGADWVKGGSVDLPGQPGDFFISLKTVYSPATRGTKLDLISITAQVPDEDLMTIEFEKPDAIIEITEVPDSIYLGRKITRGGGMRFFATIPAVPLQSRLVNSVLGKDSIVAVDLDRDQREFMFKQSRRVLLYNCISNSEATG